MSEGIYFEATFIGTTLLDALFKIRDMQGVDGKDACDIADCAIEKWDKHRDKDNNTLYVSHRGCDYRTKKLWVKVEEGEVVEQRWVMGEGVMPKPWFKVNGIKKGI